MYFKRSGKNKKIIGKVREIGFGEKVETRVSDGPVCLKRLFSTDSCSEMKHEDT